MLGVQGQRCVAQVRAEGGVATGRAQRAQQEAGQAVINFGKNYNPARQDRRIWARGPLK